MTFEEIDRALSSWNQRLAAIADNLLELQGDPTYQVLTSQVSTGTGGAQAAQLTGETASRVLPALKSIEGIFHQFSLLQSVIDRAAQLRKDLPVFGRDQTLREIEGLLLGESIQLPADAVSLKVRTLLNGVQRTIRPEQLLTEMSTTFCDARDAVLMVSSAWDDLAREVDAAETEMRGLQTQAAATGFDLTNTFAAAEETLRTLKACCQTDPLTARNQLRAELIPAVEDAARRLDAKLRLQQRISAAHEMLSKLQVTEREITAAAALSRVKILGCDPPPASVAIPPSESLAAWLARLEHRTAAEQPETIARGLENWHKAAEKALEESMHTLQQQRLPLETRSELRGRFSALKAKARAYGVAEDASVAGLAGQAEELLYAKPMDLARAAVAVEAYERTLKSPARSQQQSGSNEVRR